MNSLKTQVIGVVCQACDIDHRNVAQVSLDSKLEELGLNKDLVGLAALLNEQFSENFTAYDLREVQTVGDICSLLEAVPA
jgi:acyl carrier protein